MSVFFPGTQCPLPRARWCSSCPWCRWPQHSQSCNSSPRLGQEGFGVILNGGGKSYFKCYLYPVSSPCWLVQLPLALFCPSSFSFCLSFPLLVTLGSCVWSLPPADWFNFPCISFIPAHYLFNRNTIAKDVFLAESTKQIFVLFIRELWCLHSLTWLISTGMPATF